MMMRAGEENSSTHSKKTRTAFRESRKQNKNECVSTNESRKLTPLVLYLNARTWVPIKNTYFLRDSRQNPQKVEM